MGSHAANKRTDLPNLSETHFAYSMFSKLKALLGVYPKDLDLNVPVLKAFYFAMSISIELLIVQLASG